MRLLAELLTRIAAIVASLFLFTFVSALAQLAESGPILPSERDIPPPSRDVAAEKYSDAYCALWTDGCTVCERRHIKDDPKCVPEKEAANCHRSQVRCKLPLPTMRRVCLKFYDGCNWCNNDGECTAGACRSVTINGRTSTDPDDFVNILCTVPRASRYEHDDDWSEEFAGVWRITSPTGASCRIVIDTGTFTTGGHVAREEACSALPGQIQRFFYYSFHNSAFAFLDKDGVSILGFQVDNFEHMQGDNVNNWTLERVDMLRPAGP